MKGIILAGGTGTRLFPLTIATSKQLLPINNKPMIYYPLCTLMSMGLQDILVITTPQDLGRFQLLLGDGNQFGIRISYASQDKPEGIAQTLTIGAPFLKGESVALILGDNLFLGETIHQYLETGVKTLFQQQGAVVFAKQVVNPARFGVIEFGEQNEVLSIEEKPTQPKSNFCITGLYLFDYNAATYASQLKSSIRNELEITEVIRSYLLQGTLRSVILPNTISWLDAGTHDSYYDASKVVHDMETHMGAIIGSPEIISFCKGWIDKQKMLSTARKYGNNQYGQLLTEAADSKELVEYGYYSLWRSGVHWK